MNGVKIRIKGPRVKSLSFEQLQAAVLWIYGHVHAGRTRSPSFFSIHNRESLRSTNLVFVSSQGESRSSDSSAFMNSIYNDPEKRGLRLQEHISLEEARRLILSSIDRSQIDHRCAVLTRENTQKFMIRNTRLVYNSYGQHVTNSLSLLSIDNSSLMRFSDTTAHWLVSMDCEMVETKTGHEVGRVSVVDHQGNVLYDKCVKPRNPVVDFLTKYSGLNESILSSENTLEKVHEDLQKIIGKDTIILGHSLESDLAALQIYHEKIIDTSHLFISQDSKKVKLKNLVSRYLKDEIQKKSHCSIEDAIQCLFLLKYKVEEFSLLERSTRDLNLNATVNRLRVGTVCDAEIMYMKVRHANDLANFFKNKNLNIVLVTQKDALDILEMQRRNTDSVFMYFYEDDKKICVVI